MLTGQAKELLDVAENASSETHRLHETIERRKYTDAQIQETCGQFSTSMNVNLAGMSEALDNFTKDYKQQSHKILKQLSECTHGMQPDGHDILILSCISV